ncbi:MAG: sulfatase-like hydrolase/transferase [Coprobacillaceae bacterium]
MFKIKKEDIKKRYVIGTILVFISILIVASVIWGNRTFSVKALAQIIFHLKVPMSGTDNGIYLDWFIWCVPASIVATIIIDVFFFMIHKLFRRKKELQENISKHIRKRFVWIGSFSIVITLIFTLINYDVYGYFTNVIQKTDLYEQYYVDPSTANITFPEKKRNLIHIYLESIESTYTSTASGGAYENGYMDDLETLANDNINFSNNNMIGGSTTIDGTQWTIAAMVAQSAGIPLILPIEGNSYGKNSLFLPGSYTIGEILQEQGYNQEFLTGSDSDFAGTSNFFSQHGDYDIMDYSRAKEEGRIPEDYFDGFWGYEDKKLFTFAKEDILELAESGEPFNMTMVTIDPHTPDGQLDETCPSNFSSQYENVIACQSSQVYEFVEWAKQQDFYENTTIVITGDHNSMASKFFDGLDSNYIRTPYNVIINSAVEPENEKNRLFTTMDWYPTILASLGVEIEGDKLGLGTNLFSNKKTLLEEVGFDYLSNEVQKTSDFYNHEIIGLKD